MAFTITTIILSSIGITMACDVVWPNGTDTQANWFQCSDGPIMFFNVTTFDSSGRYEYPIHLSKPLTIKADINNPNAVYGSPTLRQTINIWRWSSSCTWSRIPTFGLLKNQDACTNGISCPLRTGRQQIDILMDFSPYSLIISFLKDNAPYQLQMVLHDDVTREDVGCITFQARARTV